MGRVWITLYTALVSTELVQIHEMSLAALLINVNVHIQIC